MVLNRVKLKLVIDTSFDIYEKHKRLFKGVK